MALIQRLAGGIAALVVLAAAAPAAAQMDWYDSYTGSYDPVYNADDWYYDYYDYGPSDGYYDYYDGYYDYDGDTFDWEEDGLF